MKKYIIATLVGLGLLLGFASPAQAAAKNSLPQITVDNQAGNKLPVSNAIGAWNRAGAVAISKGSCSGPQCIIVQAVDQQPDGTCFYLTAGCAYHTPIGTVIAGPQGECVVSIRADYFRDLGKPILLALTTHEMGHCLGLPHISDPDSVMYNPLSSSDPNVKPTAGDLAYLRNVWTGVLPFAVF